MARWTTDKLRTVFVACKWDMQCVKSVYHKLLAVEHGNDTRTICGCVHLLEQL